MAPWALVSAGLLVGLVVGVAVGLAWDTGVRAVDPAQSVLEEGSESEQAAERDRAEEFAERVALDVFETWDYEALEAVAAPDLLDLTGMQETFRQTSRTFGDLVELGEGEATLIPWRLPDLTFVRATQVRFPSEFERQEGAIVLMIIDEGTGPEVIGWFVQFA